MRAAILGALLAAGCTTTQSSTPSTGHIDPTLTKMTCRAGSTATELTALLIFACTDAVAETIPRLSHDDVANAAVQSWANTVYGSSYASAIKGQVTQQLSGFDAIQRGNEAIALPTVGAISSTFKLERAAVKDNCAADGPGSQSCKVDSDLRSVHEFIFESAKKKKAKEDEAARLAAHPPPPGVERLGVWWESTNSVSGSWELNQITEKYAVFVYTHGNGKEYVVALERDSLPPGVRLKQGQWINKTTECVKRQRSEVSKDTKGFDVPMLVVRAVPCP